MQLNEMMRQLAIEISDIALRIDSAMIDCFCQAMLTAKRVFVTGRGRSGYIAKCFAMRLMQLGLMVYCIDETNTPGVQRDDALVICSGSGETEGLVLNAKHAKRIGVKLAVVTAGENSTLAQLADICVVIPAYSSKLKNDSSTAHIMAGQFEDSMLLLLDACVAKMMETLGETEDGMMRRHKNIE